MKKLLITGSIIIVGAMALILTLTDKSPKDLTVIIKQSQSSTQKNLKELLTPESYIRLEEYSEEVDKYYIGMVEGKHGFTSREEKVIQQNKDDLEGLKNSIIEKDTEKIKSYYPIIEKNYFDLYCMPQIEVLENPYNLPRGKSEKTQYIIWKEMKSNTKVKDENKEEELEKGIEAIKELNESNDERFYHIIETLNIQVLADKTKDEYKIRTAGFDTHYDNLETLLVDLNGIF